MTDIYVYADETGNLGAPGPSGGSSYFGFGTATFADDHRDHLLEGHDLRCRLESAGVRVPRGLHAKDDSHATRSEVFDLIGRQGPRFDSTLLYKENAEERQLGASPIDLYQRAWQLHFAFVLDAVSEPGDTVYVVVGSLQTSNKRDAIRSVVESVCAIHSGDRTVVPCIWDAPSAWGIQVADYGLWAVQRIVEGRKCSWFEPRIQPTLASERRPWGSGPQTA